MNHLIHNLKLPTFAEFIMNGVRYELVDYWAGKSFNVKGGQRCSDIVNMLYINYSNAELILCVWDGNVLTASITNPIKGGW